MAVSSNQMVAALVDSMVATTNKGANTAGVANLADVTKFNNAMQTNGTGGGTQNTSGVANTSSTTKATSTTPTNLAQLTGRPAATTSMPSATQVQKAGALQVAANMEKVNKASVGDKLLAGIDKIRTNASDKSKQLRDLLDKKKGDSTAADHLKIQYIMNEHVFTWELISNVTSKCTQSINQLLTAQ